MGFQAGRLRDRINIRRLTDVPDGRGGFERTWASVVEGLAAEIISQNGREAVIASALQGISSYKITIRRRDGLKTNDQVLHRGQELNIRSIADDPFFPREAIVLFADTETPQGA